MTIAAPQSNTRSCSMPNKVSVPFRNLVFILITCLSILCYLSWCAASEQRSVPQSVCHQWNELFQQPTNQAQIPEGLHAVLTSHRGRGLWAAFEEEKKVAILKRPLRSSGHLIFLPDKGLYRKITHPFGQELLITPDAIYQREPDGKKEKMSLETLPAARGFVETFLTIFSGSWAAFQRHFKVSFSSNDPVWQLGLIPRHEIMAKLISCIVIEGEDQHIIRLWVQEANGDLTSDQFRDAKILARAEWANYQSYFDWAQ